MKLALGTAQFGLHYGISNTSGKTSFSEVIRILQEAKKIGFDTLDTAMAYGDCHETLGTLGADSYKIVSKLSAPPLLDSNLGNWIRSSIRNILRQLKRRSIYGLLLHDPCCLFSSNQNAILSSLLEAKTDGRVEKIGISVYSFENLRDILRIFTPDIVQVPFNIVDQRLIQDGWLSHLNSMAIEVHVRSVFMQGLLLMAQHQRPTYFNQWDEIFRKWDSITGGNIEVATQRCLNFVTSQPGIAKMIVGVESLQQIRMIARCLPHRFFDDYALLSSVNEDLIIPKNWRVT